MLSSGELNPTMIMRKSVRLQGIYVGSRQLFEARNRAVSAASLEPVIDCVVVFDDARAASLYKRGAAHFGKIVIRT